MLDESRVGFLPWLNVFVSLGAPFLWRPDLVLSSVLLREGAEAELALEPRPAAEHFVGETCEHRVASTSCNFKYDVVGKLSYQGRCIDK